MNRIYPNYTTIEKEPKTICNRIKESVFDFPFFNDGISKNRTKDKNNYLADKLSVSKANDLIELKGMIFHTSHCGSTLLSKMLNQVKTIRVVNESEAINGLLLSKMLYNIEESEIIKKLIKIIDLYRQRVNSERFLILKLTSWNVFEIKVFQKAFPSIKWTYIDRESEELKHSLLKSNGGFIDWWYHPVDVVRKKFIGSVSKEISKEDYLTEMIRMHRNHARKNKDDNSLFIEYPYFLNRYEEILHHFKLNITPKEMENSKEVLKFDSKSMENKIWNKNTSKSTAANKPL